MEEFIFRLKFWAEAEPDILVNTALITDTKFEATKSPVNLKVPIPEPTEGMKEHGFIKVDYVTVEVFVRVV